VQVQFEIGSPPEVNMTHPLLCGSFHKTGYQVCAEFLTIYSMVTGQTDRWLMDIDGHMVDCWYSDCSHLQVEAQTTWEQLQNLGDDSLRMLNWIRDPHSLILSAFRYHMQSPEDWETIPGTARCDLWQVQRMTPQSQKDWHKCDMSDHDAMFGLCAERCSYVQLLTPVTAVNESAGVIIEALNERQEIKTMLAMTAAHANDPRVLHLSVDHLKKDFNQTMRCINAFLGGKAFEPEQLDMFQVMDLDRKDLHYNFDNNNNRVLHTL